MIIAHLLGGNEIEGIRTGTVIVNGKVLETSYENLTAVCGNIPLDDLDTNITKFRSEKDIEKDYVKLVRAFDRGLGKDFVIDNFLTKSVCYSSYKIDFENKTLELKISAY